MIANKCRVPDHCPEECPYIEEYRSFVMGTTCETCPVFLCRTIQYEGETINLIPAESFDLAAARKWEKWFKDGMRKAPPGRRRIPENYFNLHPRYR